MTFSLDGMEFEYFDGHNDDPTCVEPRVCERRVELPIGYEFFKHRPSSNFLEVGNTLEWWYEDAIPAISHDVVDLFERRPGVLNVDITKFEPGTRYERILALSTFEHIGMPEYGDVGGARKAIDAVTHCMDLLTAGGSLLFTIPRGWNTSLEDALLGGSLQHLEKTYLRRVDGDNHWVQTDNWNDIADDEYGKRFSYATAIYVVSYTRGM